MSRYFSLARLAAAVWLSWGLLLLLMAVMLAAKSWHLPFLPPVSLVVVFLISGGLLLVGGVWRIVRGPRRLRSLGWLLLGSAPMLLLAANNLYGVNISHTRQIEPNLLLKMLEPLGESAADLETRFEYPQRTVGEKVVMISTPLPDAEQQVAAMDRHVRRLEEILGSPREGLIYWVRGPVFGVQGRASRGGCAGSTPGTQLLDAEGLSSLDRHEVAHCVIDYRRSIDRDPPALLIEGWAESRCGHDEVNLADKAWQTREADRFRSLRELTGPIWQGRHEGAVYVFGPPLVNYLLRTYGGPKFLELYVNCRREAFAEDCQRILGVSLDELDAEYWADIERLTTANKPQKGCGLELLEIDPKVDHEAWRKFVAEFPSAMEQLRGPFATCSIEFDEQRTHQESDGKEFADTSHAVLLQSGQKRLLRTNFDWGALVCLAVPERSASARRLEPDPQWRFEFDASEDPQWAFRRQSRNIDHFSQSVDDPCGHFPGVLKSWADSQTEHVVVTGCELIEESGEPRVRVDLELRQTDESNEVSRRATFVFAPEDRYALQWYEDDLASGGGEMVRGELEYDHRDGVPLLRTLRSVGKRDGTEYFRDTTIVTARHFEPMSPEQFMLEHAVGGSVLPYLPPKEPVHAPSVWLRCSCAIAIAGCLSLIAGLALLAVTRKGA